MARVTRTMIITRLHELGYEGADLWNAGDYWVFSGGIADRFEQQGVYVMRLSDMSVEQWVAEFISRARKAEAAR